MRCELRLPVSGGILADDQGLGKTLTTIALMLTHPPGGAYLSVSSARPLHLRHPCLHLATPGFLTPQGFMAAPRPSALACWWASALPHSSLLTVPPPPPLLLLLAHSAVRLQAQLRMRRWIGCTWLLGEAVLASQAASTPSAAHPRCALLGDAGSAGLCAVCPAVVPLPPPRLLPLSRRLP